MYHFSDPSPSINPPEEFELSLPLLCLPLVKGVDVPGGDIDRFGFGPGDDVPGERDSGGTYLCEEDVVEKGKGFVEVVLEACVTGCCAWILSVPAFVVMVFDVEVAFVVVVETCGVETSEVGDIEDAGLDLA